MRGTTTNQEVSNLLDLSQLGQGGRQTLFSDGDLLILLFPHAFDIATFLIQLVKEVVDLDLLGL